MFGDIYHKKRFLILPVIVIFIMTGGFLFYEKAGAAVQPIINKLNPERVKAGSRGFELDIEGYNFLPDAKAFLDNVGKVTKFISQNLLKVDIGASDIINPGTRRVDIKNSSGTIGETISEFFGTLYVDALTPEEAGLRVSLFSGLGAVAFDAQRSSGLKELSLIFGAKEIVRVSLNSLDFAFAAKTPGTFRVLKDGVLEKEEGVVSGIFKISLTVAETEASVRNMKFISSGGAEVFDVKAVFSQGRLVQIFSDKFILSSADIDGLAAGEGIFTIKATGLDGKFSNTSAEVLVQ